MDTETNASTSTAVTSPGTSCTLRMEDDYELDLEQLKAHSPQKIAREWRWPGVAFVRYENNALNLRVSSGTASFVLTLIFCEEHMKVSCSCQMAAEERLCVHGFSLLQRLVIYRTRFFGKFRPGGIVDFASRHKRYFSLKWQFEDLRLVKKNFNGKPYSPRKKPSLLLLEQAMQRAGAEEKRKEQTELVPCYFILECFRRTILPFIVPCLGTLNKAGTTVKGFHRYLSGIEKKYEHLLTDEQKTLNLLCLDLYKLADAMPGDLMDNEVPMDEEKLGQWCKLWKQALRFLQDQPFVFHSPLRWRTDLKGKPAKKYARKIRCYSDEPTIGFTLFQKEEFAQLQLTARTLQGRPFNDFDADLPFFIQADDNFYFLSSVRDAAVVQWMQEQGPEITVFKEHYPRFETEILHMLRGHYKIEIVQRK